jgi:carbamate kinase
MSGKATETLLIALGGNAISSPQGRGEIAEQMEAIHRSCRVIARIIQRGAQVVLTHGNGPQVGNLLIQQEEAQKTVPSLPLDVCVAMTQGQIGYLLQQALQNALKAYDLSIPVTTVITQVVVDPRDPAFENPTKPIGPFYSEREAERLQREKGYMLKRIGQGEKPYRRVVPSPKPLEIVEEGGIRELVEAGHVVIACGGGGVPVVRTGSCLRGVEAVVDKDLASERLATALGLKTLLILTDVERVALRYGTLEQIELEELSLEEARRYLKEGEFPPGSMGPKIEAAIKFLEHGGERVVIAALNQAEEALAGRAGTEIVP